MKQVFLLHFKHGTVTEVQPLLAMSGLVGLGFRNLSCYSDCKPVRHVTTTKPLRPA